KQYYLDPLISLERISQLLGVNRNLLSKAINKVFDVNFNTYINNHRIKKVLSIITDKKSIHNFNLEGIAKKVGFSNRTTFIAAFKHYTGMTPSTFIHNLPTSTDSN
ncbi:MAG: AraC family transcriptional regulator, partial [Ignavibacteria bacterium]|nr:AraC family transcriptional regulator [Ignavibacteria bacterium]